MSPRSKAKKVYCGPWRDHLEPASCPLSRLEDLLRTDDLRARMERDKRALMEKPEAYSTVTRGLRRGYLFEEVWHSGKVPRGTSNMRQVFRWQRDIEAFAWLMVRHFAKDWAAAHFDRN